MAKYKIGDKVKIRKDLKGNCYYGGLYFATEMEEYKGKTATITNINACGNYSIDLVGCWVWNDDMFENAILTKKQLNDKISELEKQIAELKEQLEKKDDKMPVGEIWRPKENEKYCHIRYDGIALCTNTFDDIDNHFIESGNCYPTKEKAEFEAQREKYTRLFRQYVEQHSEPLDWNDSKQAKWYMYYDYDNDKIEYIDCFISRILFTIYASSKQVLKEAIDFVGEDNVKKYILECE